MRIIFAHGKNGLKYGQIWVSWYYPDRNGVRFLDNLSHGDKKISDSVELRLELFEPPFVTGLDPIKVMKVFMKVDSEIIFTMAVLILIR